MLKKIWTKTKKTFEKLKDDYMRSPKSMKILNSLGVLAIIAVVTISLNGCVYGVSRDFALKMQERANEHFPKYKRLVKESNNRQLEKLEGLDKGTLDNVADEKIDRLKNSIYLEIDAWRYEINANADLAKDMNNEQRNQ